MKQWEDSVEIIPVLMLEVTGGELQGLLNKILVLNQKLYYKVQMI